MKTICLNHAFWCIWNDLELQKQILKTIPVGNMVEYWPRRRATIFQRWYKVEASTLNNGRFSTLNQRWNMVEASTLTMVEKWLSVWCVHDFEIIIVSCLFPSPHSIYWITIMLMQLNQRLHSRWTDAIIHGCALDACRKVLNPFAASGHLHHANSVRVYVQMMRCLTE